MPTPTTPVYIDVIVNHGPEQFIIQINGDSGPCPKCASPYRRALLDVETDQLEIVCHSCRFSINEVFQTPAITSPLDELNDPHEKASPADSEKKPCPSTAKGSSMLVYQIITDDRDD